ncbi:hypothetical protein MC885_004176, partial [Smutsia gigantea]
MGSAVTCTAREPQGRRWGTQKPASGLAVNLKSTSLPLSQTPASRLRFTATLPAICPPGCISNRRSI